MYFHHAGTNTMQVNTANLTAMGYRPLDTEERRWGKPVGKALLFYREDTDTLQLMFRGVNETLLHSESVVGCQNFDDVEADATSFLQHGSNFAWPIK